MLRSLSASVGDEAPGRFDVVPLIYDKKIPIPLRKLAVVHLVKYLQRAFLSNHAFRSSDSEEAIWKELGGTSASHEQRFVVIVVVRSCPRTDVLADEKSFSTPLSRSSRTCFGVPSRPMASVDGWRLAPLP
jgi:hypothetical protein